VTHAGGSPDPRELPPKGLRARDIYAPLCRTRHNRTYPEPDAMPSITLKPRNFR
jgi:hypothetical protein